MSGKAKVVSWTAVALTAIVTVERLANRYMDEQRYQRRLQWEYMAAVAKAHDTGKWVEECLPPTWKDRKK